VTGASSGIGREFARLLAARGYDLALAARREDRLEALAAELVALHRVGVSFHSVDLCLPADRARLQAEVEAGERRVDILVNCAGFGIYSPFAVSDRARELAQVQLLVEAVVDLDGRFVPAMVSRDRGVLINVASTAGFKPLPGNGTYSAAKAFVMTHTEALAEELRGSGVTATAVCPGPVPTEFFEVGQPLVVNRIPRTFWSTAERVASDGVRAADRGATAVIPGGIMPKLLYGPYRTAPRMIAVPIARYLMAGELARTEAVDADQPERVGEK
jgi:hypothetical protein